MKSKTLNIIGLVSIMFLSMFAFSGCQNISSLSEGIGRAIYNPVYQEKIVGYDVTEVTDETGKVISSKSEPVIHKVITKYEPNELGKLLKLGGSLIPIPGASTATDGLLAAGALAMGGMEILRRREKKKRLVVEDYVEVVISGVEEFSKTEAGKVIVDAGIDKGKEIGKLVKNKISEEAAFAGISQPLKKLVKLLT